MMNQFIQVHEKLIKVTHLNSEMFAEFLFCDLLDYLCSFCNIMPQNRL
jgi:hypothetical protein